MPIYKLVSNLPILTYLVFKIGRYSKIGKILVD